MNKIVIYPGRFQPMLSHHAEVFKQLQSQFPDAEVYIGTSDKVELPKSPFNFKEKQMIAAAHGVPADRVLAVTRPYHQEDYAKYFNPADTIIIFAVGEKDLDRFPFNNMDPKTGLDMTVRGEAKPKYYQKINTLKADPKPMSERGYITLAPTIKIGDEVASASAFRDALKAAPDAESAKQIYTKQFGTYNDKVFNLIYNKIARADMSEQINILRKLAGLPVREAAPVEFSGADAKTAKFLPPSASSAKMSIANRFPKGADVNDPAVKQEQFIQALLRSPEALISEFSERLDPKDDNSLAVGQKLSDIVQLMNQKDIGVSGLPKDMKQFVLDLTVNAVKNMDLSAGDDSPAYSDIDDEDEFEKESVDLSNIRNDYGVEEAKDEDELEEGPFKGVGKMMMKHKLKKGIKKAQDDTYDALDKMFDKDFSDEKRYDDEKGFATSFSDLKRKRKALDRLSREQDYAKKLKVEITNTGSVFVNDVRVVGRTNKTKNNVIHSEMIPAGELSARIKELMNNQQLKLKIAKLRDELGTPNIKEVASIRAKHDKLDKDEEEDDDSWIPSEDEFDQEIKHGYKGRTTEGFSSEADMVLAKVGSGELDAYDVMTRPQGPAQAQAAEIIQGMYDDVAVDHHLHPDDDFEKILDIVTDQLDKDYGNSDADTHEAVNPYAVGMASAMKSTGDKPPLSKKTIKKAHKIAKAVAKNEAVEETAGNALEAAMAELRKLAGLR